MHDLNYMSVSAAAARLHAQGDDRVQDDCHWLDGHAPGRSSATYMMDLAKNACCDGGAHC